SIYLPRAPEQEPAGNPAPSDNSVDMAAKGELILVVEDDDRVRDVTSKRLENLGYNVREARSAMEAIEWLESKAPIKLVFSDILRSSSRLKVLPKPYSTAELARHIRKLLDS